MKKPDPIDDTALDKGHRKVAALLKKEFGVDKDGDPRVEATLVDRTRCTRLQYRPMLYLNGGTMEEDFQKSTVNLRLAAMNLSIAQGDLDRTVCSHLAFEEHLRARAATLSVFREGVCGLPPCDPSKLLFSVRCTWNSIAKTHEGRVKEVRALLVSTQKDHPEVYAAELSKSDYTRIYFKCAFEPGDIVPVLAEVNSTITALAQHIQGLKAGKLGAYGTTKREWMKKKRVHLAELQDKLRRVEEERVAASIRAKIPAAKRLHPVIPKKTR